MMSALNINLVVGVVVVCIGVAIAVFGPIR